MLANPKKNVPLPHLPVSRPFAAYAKLLSIRFVPSPEMTEIADIGLAPHPVALLVAIRFSVTIVVLSF
jgi:hypothetical protein